jgi:hypothetical protein
MVRAAFVLGFVLAGLLVPADVAQAQQPATGLPSIVYVTRVIPPIEWRIIYQEVERCVGQRGDYDSVEWYVTNSPWQGAHGTTMGLWRAPGKDREIVVPWGIRYETINRKIVVVRNDTLVVRHEALHDILHRNGFRPKRAASDSTTNPEHPMPPFGKCAERYAK